MSERIHALAFHLLGKSSVDECSLSEVQQLAGNHPYFAPAQFLLLQKLKTTDASAYEAQLQKAVLYYHNPLRFEQFVNEDRFYTELSLQEHLAETEPAVATAAAVVEPEPLPGEAATEPVQEEASQIPALEASANEPEASANTTAVQSQSVAAVAHTPPAVARVTDELAFEPYHTVDYFASQGIKLSQEEISKDKFGKQLKSFTEWLKSMKRLPAAEQQKEESHSEKKVQHLAEDSVHEADVVTEAMAEVWIKQGKPEKAIETYNKLSLLNPSKRAYFAALIENLKNS